MTSTSLRELTFKLVLITLYISTPFLATAQWTQIGADIDGEAAGDFSGQSVSMPDANTLAIGATANNGNGISSGHVRIYEKSGSSWVQKGLDIDGEAAGDQSSFSISMPDASTLAIGANANDGNGNRSGHVRIYEWSGTAWVQKGVDIDGEAAEDQSGIFVSMPDANTVAIGATGNDGNGFAAGHVRIYTWDGTAWNQKGLDIDGEAALDQSGNSVHMVDANTIAIGAIANGGNGNNSGHVRIYAWSGTLWVQKGIDIDGEAAFDNSSRSVNMPDVNTIAIGALGNDGNGTDAGHVRIYTWNGTAWVQKGIDIDGEAASDISGISVSMPDANTLAIGATANDGNGTDAGHVRIYRWNGTAWAQQGIDIDGEAAGDQSGFSVSMPDANTVAIGANRNDGNGTDAGHVRVFSFCTSSAIIATQTNVSCNGGNDGSITVSADSGTANYSYRWSNSDSTINVSDTFNTITALLAGQYFVTITDGNTCTAIDSVTITEPAALVAAASLDNAVSCNGLSDGEATASATGGSAPYTYTWNTANTTASISGRTANNYYVTVTDNNGCTDSASVTITEPAALVASASLDNAVSCNGLSDGGATASATGGTSPFTYSWSTGNTTASISGRAANNYYVTVTDNNGCTDSASVTITEPAALNASISINNNVSCFGTNDGSLTANIIGGTIPYTYNWDNSATTATASSLAAGGYTVTITDANGCIDSASAFITSPIALSINTTSTNVSCNGGSDGTANAGVAGGVSPYTYLWSNAATSASTSGLSATTYTVTVTDNNGCSSVTVATINEPTSISLTMTPSNVSCNGGSDGAATVIASGGTSPYTYLWSNAATTTTTSGLSATTYSVTVTDNNGCTSVSATTINEPTTISLTTTPTDVSCNSGADGSASVVASGGTSPYTYLWSNAAITATTTGLSATSYSVTVTDNNGCSSVSSTTISEPALLNVTLTIDSLPSSFGASDGGLSANVSGGIPSYTYQWSSTPSTSSSITGLSAGIYTVTVTDNNNCTSTSSIILSEPALLSCSITTSNVTCSPGSDGSATVIPSGGVTPYTYSWSNSGITNTINNLSAGSYTITVTDNNGITTTCNAFISSPAAVNANEVIVDASCNGLSDGSITLNTSGGTAAYTYLWNTNATTSAITSLSASSYTVTITDANACSSVETFLVNVGDNIPPTAIAQNLNVYLDFNGMANITANNVNNGSTDNCTISSLLIDSTNFDCSEIGINTVELLVIDNNGNRDSTTATITVIDTIRPVALASNTTLYLDANGQASVLPSSVDNGSIDNCSIASLELDSTTFDCSEIGPNTALYTVTDINGNKDSINIVLTVLDTIKPNPISQAVTVYLDANRETSITASQVDNGSFDACQLDSVTISKSFFNCTEVGNNTIQLIAYDNSGNVDSTNAIITVIDTIGARRDTMVVSACGSYTWMQNNINYTVSGFYRDTTLNSIGCDSIYHNLDLTIIDVLTSTDVISACDSIVWINGLTYFSDNNTAADTLISSLGCDSIVTLNLTIFNANGSNEITSSCDSYLWPQNGITYTASGLYTDTLSNTDGCDSVIALDLTILPLDLNVVNTGDSIFAVQAGISYQWIDCDKNNSIIAGATDRGYKPDTTGHFAVIVDNGLCFDTSSCNLVRFVGLNKLSFDDENFKVYPVPTNDQLFIQTDKFSEDRTIRVFSLNGRLIFEKQAIENLEKIEVEGWDAGIYLIHYQNKMKKVIVTK